MNQKDLSFFFGIILNDSPNGIHEYGYRWLVSDFLPRVEQAANMESFDANLLAECYYHVGDVYDFNNAPKKALEYYEKAIACAPDFAEAYREIGSMYGQLGEYEKALDAINKALEINPDDEDALEEKEITETDILEKTPPLVEEDPFRWECYQKLANEEFEALLEDLKDKTGNRYLKFAACACGGLEEDEDYLEYWKKIQANSESIELSFEDWFYMPDSVYNDRTIWDILKDCAPRIKPGIFEYHPSFYEAYAPTMENAEVVKTMCLFHIYQIEKDQANIEKLQQKYPLWEEVAELQQQS